MRTIINTLLVFVNHFFKIFLKMFDCVLLNYCDHYTGLITIVNHFLAKIKQIINKT